MRRWKGEMTTICVQLCRSANCFLSNRTEKCRNHSTWGNPVSCWWGRFKYFTEKTCHLCCFVADLTPCVKRPVGLKNQRIKNNSFGCDFLLIYYRGCFSRFWQSCVWSSRYWVSSLLHVSCLVGLLCRNLLQNVLIWVKFCLWFCRDSGWLSCS